MITITSLFEHALARLLATDRDRTPLAQRILLGLVVFPHGAQKLLGWFGGYGLSGTMGYFTGTMHLPAPLALLIIVGESLGAVGLVLGAGTRVAALGIAAIMIGAIATTHARFGFFMNWFGAQQGEGFEYHLLVLALALPLAVRGAGALSIDGALAGRLLAGASPLAQPQGA
ncbi:MAG TPA: DoxX family protein [Kofleriaceae bacterium]|nr:DoxX family protein [Kofleriaceae bacterium]